MRKIETETPIQETGGTRKMGRKRERKLTDGEVVLLNKLVEACVRILRNKEISVQHPGFQDEKKSAIEEIFKANGIISKDQQDRLWPSLATRIQIMITIPPEEHFRKKRMKELQTSLREPDDERTRELLDIATANISILTKDRGVKKIDATIIRDAVYQTIAPIRYPSKRSKETEAKTLKFYLCAKYKIPTSHPDLKSLSDPSRQRDIFATA